ncbi:DUF3576 domain-containing protein [Acidocella sp.]|uniref:DUF3576 domain-containing protein n=1 Tax=Acidocella sp. TaxID=50710 RepID=UPI002612432B|nr:DUF3576 domain-containing protein [Acidocella sp.]
MRKFKTLTISAPLAAALALTACSGLHTSQAELNTPADAGQSGGGSPSLFTFGKGSGGAGTAQATQIQVNAYLWRASLETLAFMPLASADPFGGVIITDWYSPPATPGERFKVNAYILGKQLTANAIKVSVFHQIQQPDGSWADAPADPSTAAGLENRILAEAANLQAADAASK